MLPLHLLLNLVLLKLLSQLLNVLCLQRRWLLLRLLLGLLDTRQHLLDLWLKLLWNLRKCLLLH